MSRTILPEPPEELKQLSRTLLERIREEIEAEGAIPFSRYMERVLYEPGLGYYSAGLHKLGEAGDFVTSPELGSLFARCLAGQVREVGEWTGAFDILEIGAGTGRLAADLLAALPSDAVPSRYLILERSADLRAVQQETIARRAPEQLHRVEWLDGPPVSGWKGVLIANEVIDALAVERFRIGQSGIEQLCVTVGDDGLAWASRPAPPDLDRAVRHIESDNGRELPLGYRSEVLVHLQPWVDEMVHCLEHGLALFIDYGYPRAQYYLPERSDGTVMCHYRHRAHDNVFFWPGLQDITAWVDFTALAEASDSCGLEVEGFCSQAMFLMGCGLTDELAALGAGSEDGGLAVNEEARQLTLPGLMGERFKVMGLGRGLEEIPRGFSLQDLRHLL